LGFGGPGSAVLSLCGQPLFGGATAQLLLANATPDTPALLITSDVMGFAPLGMGTLVPFPPVGIQSIFTDAQGGYSQEQDVYWVLAADTFYAQVIIPSPGGPELSNAIEIRFEQADGKALRDQRYKLIFDPYLCTESLYDLEADPFEHVELLSSGPLSPEASQAYTGLRTKLGELLAP
jgi:hypothetical protein